MDEVITAADASANLRSLSSEPSILPSNLPLLAAFLSFALAQFLKLFTTWYKEKRWDSKRMLSSGGMPSSHSATVTALAVAIGLQEGTGGSEFAIAVVLACVVCTLKPGWIFKGMKEPPPSRTYDFYRFQLSTEYQLVWYVDLKQGSHGESMVVFSDL